MGRGRLSKRDQHQSRCDGAGGAIEEIVAHDLVSFLPELRDAAPLGETGLGGHARGAGGKLAKWTEVLLAPGAIRMAGWIKSSGGELPFGEATGKERSAVV